MPDSATDFLNNSILPQETQTKARVTFGLDASADDAARTLDLSQSTGVPASVIAPDLDHFDKGNQANLARSIVMGNPKLRDYVNSHQLAAQVSNDDWGTLDNVSKSAGMFGELHSFLNTDFAKAASDRSNPMVGRIGAAVVEEAKRFAQSAWGAATLPGDIATGKTTMADPEAQARALDMGQFFGMKEAPGPLGHTHAAKAPGGAWTEAGEEPPAGLHPDIDASKAEINAKAVDQLKDLLTEAQASTTKDRSPEMFKSFMDQHFGNATIGINGDAVAKLYGDKLPSPDDNLLGWAVGIGDKLDAARATGADVEIPISHWVSHVDPALAKELHDDIRVWPGGVTANEAKEAVPPPTMVDAPLAQVRGAAGLEPQFSMGDRKLTLNPISQEEADPALFPGGQFHTLEIQDDRGVKVGDLTITPDAATKTLHVEMINGVAGQWANSFGPGLIMDLKRQLAAMYPEYDKLSGYRVEGTQPGRDVTVKLSDDAPAGWGKIEATRRAIAESYRPVGQFGVDVNIQPSSAYLTHEKAVAGAIHEEIAKMTGGKAKVTPTAGIKYNDRPVAGVHFPGTGMIMYDLLGDDPVGVGRHETIHFLKTEGLFTPKEWDTLTTAANEENWHDRYGINTRYAELKPEAKTEEAIAEGFREWMQNRTGREYSPVAQIFQKLHEFLGRISQRMAEIFGHIPTKDELFTKVASGDVADRAASTSPTGGRPQFSEQDHLDNLKASGLGLDLKSFQRLQKLYEERHQADVEASLKHAEREQARRQTKEWKDNKAEMAKDVEESIRQRPDVAADLFIGSGELYGEKHQQRFTLRADDLTPEQKASLPAHYVSKNGLPTDDVARLFGYTSGDAMVGHLAEYNAIKGDRSPQKMLQHMVEVETNRQMEAKYGNLAENILSGAKDQALSENSIDILTEEYHAAALQAGVTAMDKATAKAAIEKAVGEIPIGELNSNKYMATMAKHGAATERALIAEDYPSAVQAMQRKLLAAMLAKEARTVEKEMTSFDKLAKTMSKREVTSMDPEYTNYVHQILQSIGKPVRRSIQDLQEAIAAGHSKNLSDFVDWKTSALREMPVWDQLFDDSWKKGYKQLTVEEFRNIHDSVKTLVHNGRDELKINRAGEAADFADVRKDLIDKVSRFTPLTFDVKGERTGAVVKATQPVKIFTAQHMQIETILNHWDEEDPKGPWNQYVMRDLIDGVNQEAAYRKEYAAKLRDAHDGVDLNKSVDNTIFRVPTQDGSGPLVHMNRGNLRAVMLNLGNASNEMKQAKGWGLSRDEVRGFVHSNATKEDWEFAQKIWDMHGDIWAKIQTMYRNLSGVAPKSVNIHPIDTPFGQYKGGYYPVMYHPEFEGTSKKLLGKDALEGDNYVRATPPSGYTKERTGYAAPTAMDLDMLGGRIGQQLHDLSMRPAVINVSKVFTDHKIRAEIMAHYGTETRDLLMPYLKDVANSANYESRAQSQMAHWSEFFRQNMVATLIGLNPGTVLKHGPTAFVQSINEVGAPAFLKAAKSMFSINEATGESNWNTAMTKSLELQRRSQNYAETITGAMQQLSPKPGLDSLRHTIIRLGTTPVALSDLLSAVPTWLAAYEKGLADFGNEGDAIYAGDRSVRRAHGSSAITSRPAVMRDYNPWLTSVYTFFSHIMNRQAELAWKSGDMLKATGQADYGKAMGMIPKVSAQLFAYVVFPALIEEMVSPLTTSDGDSWAKKAAKSTAFTLSSSWVGVRDIASGLLSGRDPSVGIYSTAGVDALNAYRDLKKDGPLNRDHAGRVIQDFSTLAGILTGLPGGAIGKAGRFVHDVNAGVEHPKGPWGWLVGARYGTLKNHSATLSDYVRGR